MGLDELQWSHPRVPRGYGHVACAHRAQAPSGQGDACRQWQIRLEAFCDSFGPERMAPRHMEP
jgi:hypothetical protein